MDSPEAHAAAMFAAFDRRANAMLREAIAMRDLADIVIRNHPFETRPAGSLREAARRLRAIAAELDETATGKRERAA